MPVLLAVFFSMILLMSTVQASEPIVVLTYGESRGDSGAALDEYNSHPLLENQNLYKAHQVLKDETLGHVMEQYYGGSGLNMKFVEIAILHFNRSAFVRGNPNFLYAGKTLHLPSVNQIRDLITGKKSSDNISPKNGTRNEIFFFGG
ncbi:pilus assembly protein FimV [Candidatus Puniceispirillum sp.]|nr:pilus assembly protein FimV [Candidatus Puniceispirillum sp.]